MAVILKANLFDAPSSRYTESLLLLAFPEKIPLFVFIFLSAGAAMVARNEDKLQPRGGKGGRTGMTRPRDLPRISPQLPFGAARSVTLIQMRMNGHTANAAFITLMTAALILLIPA